MKLHVLRCGEIGLPPGLTTSGGDRFAALAAGLRTPESRRVWLPAAAYLIEHPRGLIMVDAGLPEAASRPGEARVALGGALHSVMHVRARREELADRRLRALGARPGDIAVLVLTHLDADHAGGASLLRGAGRMLVAQEERFWASRSNFRYVRRIWGGEPLETFWFRPGGLGPDLGRCHDLMGDGSVMLVELPGHTAGSTAVLVRGGERYVLLCGDSAASPRSWREGLVPGMAENPAWQRRSLDWIKTMAQSPNCLACLASHDPEVPEGPLLL